MKSVAFVFLSLAFTQPLIAESTVTITKKGSTQTIEVTPLELTEDAFVFELQFKEYTFPLAQLDAASLDRITQWSTENAEQSTEIYETANQAIGLPLFLVNKRLWNEDIDLVAQRLQWNPESLTETCKSYRKYPTDSDRFLGARPYCYSLYGSSDGTCESLSIVFANKGDFFSNVGFGEDHFKKKEASTPQLDSLQGAIHKDIETISTLLTTHFGEPKEQRYGEKEDRRDVQRWNFKGHAFILSEREKEYAHLLIVDLKTADNEGKVDFIKDQDARQLIEKNVTRSENGDVIISNIPMVNQGPKGYCAPATFERAMRYMFVPADMYLLATLATDATGGTNTVALSGEAKRIIRSKARRIKDLDLEDDLSIRLVSRYIDKGVPIMWQMASVDAYNELANSLTEKRPSTTDLTAWKIQITADAEKALPSITNESNYHICLIIGYNEQTQELAVSDSWGPRYALRWVPIDIAKAVTTRGGFIIDL